MLRIGQPGLPQPLATAPMQAGPPPPPMGAHPPLPPPLMPSGAMPPGADPDQDGDDDSANVKSGQKRYDLQKVDPDISGYMSSDKGPFECQRCVHFEGPASCGVVSGPIDPRGCCNLFDTDGDDNPDQDADSPAGPEVDAAGGQS